MSILVATDLSAAAKHAARIAATFARTLDEDLVLVSALEPLAYPTGFLTMADTLWRPQVDEALAAHAAELSRGGVTVSHRAAIGFAEDVIKETIAQTQPSLLVLGAHGRTAAAMFTGSTTERLVRRLRVPMLAVRAEEGPLDAWDGARPLRLTVGADASAATTAALDWVRALRQRLAVDVTVTHVFSPAVEHARLGLPDPGLGHLAPGLGTLLERELAASVGELGGRGSLALRLRPAWAGAPSPLVEELERDAPDLAVVGTHQRHGWDALASGSIAVTILRATNVPVVAVPLPAAEPGTRTVGAYQRVLAATDLSPDGNRAVASAYALARGAAGTVDLCHVVDEAPLGAATRTRVEESLRALVPLDAGSLGIATRTHVLPQMRTVAETILAEARVLRADAIVLGTRGRSSVGQALLGSVAAEVIRGAPIPVLTVGPAGA